MFRRTYRVISPASPTVLVARLREFLQRGRPTNLFEPHPYMPDGDIARVDEQMFHFRLHPAEQNAMAFWFSGTMQPSGGHTEVVFHVWPSVKNLWVFGMAGVAFSAFAFWGFWPISFGLAAGAAVGPLLLMAMMVLLMMYIGRWKVSRYVTALLTAR